MGSPAEGGGETVHTSFHRGARAPVLETLRRATRRERGRTPKQRVRGWADAHSRRPEYVGDALRDGVPVSVGPCVRRISAVGCAEGGRRESATHPVVYAIRQEST